MTEDPRCVESRSRHVQFQKWTRERFREGICEGAVVGPEGVSIEDTGARPAKYRDPFGEGVVVEYETGSWTSPAVKTDFDISEAVASWNADTPGGGFVRVEARLGGKGGIWTRWYTLGIWSSDADEGPKCTSVAGQEDADVRVDTDILRAASTSYRLFQVRAILHRPLGTLAAIRLRLVGMMASWLPDGPVVVSPSGLGRGIQLDVPRFSQEIHRGEYPELNGGGEAWCSPTSTMMAVYSWGRTVAPADLASVEAPRGDPQVDWGAMQTFDHRFGGTGNWPFNTATAARFRLEAFVTRLRSLAEAERFILSGIPLVASVAFTRDELPEAGYQTAGHLLVIVGFTADGDVIVNDPASPDDEAVRRVYPRERFESAWCGHSGGTVYVIRPEEVPLPPLADLDEPNW